MSVLRRPYVLDVFDDNDNSFLKNVDMMIGMSVVWASVFTVASGLPYSRDLAVSFLLSTSTPVIYHRLLSNMFKKIDVRYAFISVVMGFLAGWMYSSLIAGVKAFHVFVIGYLGVNVFIWSMIKLFIDRKYISKPIDLFLTPLVIGLFTSVLCCMILY